MDRLQSLAGLKILQGREKVSENPKGHSEAFRDLVASPAGDQRISFILWILLRLRLHKLNAGGCDVRLILEVALNYDLGDVRLVGNGAVIPETESNLNEPCSIGSCSMGVLVLTRRIK